MFDGEDAINAVHRTIYPQLHYLLRGTFGGYAVSHTTADEYVLTARCSEATLDTVCCNDLPVGPRPPCGPTGND